MIEGIIFSKILAFIGGLFLLFDFIFGIKTISRLKIKGKKLFYLSGVLVIELVLILLSLVVILLA